VNDKSKSQQKNVELPKAVPLAIVGIGCLFPKANDAKAYWTNIRDGVDAITDIPDTHWKPEDYFDTDPGTPDMTYARRGGFIDPVDFDPLLYGLSPNNIEATDTTQLLGMAVARQALLDAGYATAKDSDDGRQFDRDRTSVILGVTGTLELVIPLGARLGHPIWRKALADAGVDKDVAEDVVQRISEGYVPWQENSFPGLLGNVAAGRIANRFDLGGTNCVVDAACASSLSAIHMAALELYAGRSDMAITGGFDSFNDIFMYMCFSKTPALSPSGNAKPFDHNGDGTILGEGLGAVILKRLDDAKRDGDHIYAVLKGIGSSSDGKGNAIYAPSASGQTKALKDAYEQANVRPRSIELLEAHGTGTKVGDAVEATALSAVYREDQAEGSWCAIGSVKSMIGHTKAAAGIAGMIKIAMALSHKVLPPTIKVDQPLDLLEPGQAPVYVNTSKRPWIAGKEHPRRAALSAFGFGGSNFHCVLEEAEQEKPEIEWDGKVLLFSFSADTIDELQTTLGKLDHQQDWAGLRADAARSRQSFSAGQAYRLTLLVTEQTKLDKLLNNATAMLSQQTDKTSWSTPDGAYFGSGAQTGKMAMLFPGQGSQYTNMLLDLACQFPQMQSVLTQVEAEFSEFHTVQRLNDLIYPIAAFSDEARQQNEEKLRATQHAQPAIGATSLGAFNILQHFGIKAEATAGHSFGELTALCAAGKIDDEDLHKLAIKRGELMQAKTGDHGAMLAVAASAAIVHEFLEAVQLDLIIANNNAPTQVVLSGATDQIDQALGRLQEQGIGAKKLPVSAAFHSTFVAAAEKPFAEFMQGTAFKQSEISVYANTTAESYPEDSDERKALLSGQLAKPVEFVAQIENMYAAGINTFIEVGPGKTLSTLVKSILGEKEHQAIALDVSRGKRSGQYDLASLLAQVSVLGYAVDLDKWDSLYLDAYEAEATKKKSLMTISISGANYVKPRSRREAVSIKPVMKNEKSTAVSATPAAAMTPAQAPQLAQATQSIPDSQINDVMQITQQSILALQKMQEQTAQLHKQYLQGQQTSQQSIQQLIQQQQAMLTGGIITPAISQPEPTVVAAPAPVVVPSPPLVEPVVEEPKVQTTSPAEVQPQAVVSTASDSDHYETLLLEVVAEKTGYPVDMLSMGMSLDTDLGIDSIKRVEILSALQEKLPGVSKIQPEDLGTFQLLKHIVEFLAADTPLEQAPVTEATVAVAVADTKLQEVLLEVVADKTGYPADMLNLEMNMDTDLGIDSIKRVEILSAFQEKMPEAPTVNPEDLATLQTLQQIVDFMQSNMPVTESTVTSVPAVAESKFQQVLLEVVADKTGYPAEMLNLEMNMDTDLGIDSIKRVEILSAFQEKMPEAPTVNPEDLATLQTLQQIVDFMQGQSQPAQAESVVAATATTETPIDKLQAVLLEVVADKTGYPVDMLNLDMNMDTDLGIDSIKRVEILSAFQEKMPEAPTVNPEDLVALQTLQQIVDHMADGSSENNQVQANAAPATIQEDNNIYRSIVEVKPLINTERHSITLTDGSLLLVSDDGSDLPQKICAALTKLNLRGEIISLDAQIDSSAKGLIILAPVNADSDFILSTFQLVQRAADTLKQAGKNNGALLVSVTRLGGAFGIEALSSANPVSGGLAGLIKTADKEWADVHCKALDIAANRSSALLASTIVEEALTQGPLETGIRDEGLCQLSLNTAIVAQSETSDTPLNKGDVLVITGGARGVTAEVAVAMAKSCQCNLLLLGRSPLPAQEPTWLTGLQEEAVIKKAIIEHGGLDKPTPAAVEEKYKQILASREIMHNILRMQDCGVKVLYQSVDVRDQSALADAINTAHKELGNIAGIIHGAGVLADRLIEDKTPEQFQQVYATKVDGLKALLETCKKDKLKTIVMFSSSTARLGRKGQVDYAIANEVLNKIAQEQQNKRPDCRVLSVNWGPWDGGMVTPQLRKLFESEGVGVIPLQAGADYLVQEIATKGPVEVVVLGSELETDSKTAEQSKALDDSLHLVSERQLNVDEYSVLKSHVMNGKAVLPAALIAEWLAHGAMHNHPGLSFIGFNDFRVLKGVVIDTEENIDLQIMAGQTVMKDNEDLVIVELRSGKVLHARAEAVLGTNYAQAQPIITKDIVGKYPFSNREYYANGQLFHGPDLQCIETITACSEEGIAGQSIAAPAPSQWMSQPARSSWLADPMVLDASFQMMILWSFQQTGTASLPTKIASYRQFQSKFPKEGASLNIHIEKATTHAATATIEFLDKQQNLIARIEGYECVIDASLNEAFKRNTLEVPAKA
jgi:acyl transferase domain-containing protein/acyl carrier protein/NAD(P)-dependent dehydrogenase (short-subunit alcohol dehydrogenase family)